MVSLLKIVYKTCCTEPVLSEIMHPSLPLSFPFAASLSHSPRIRPINPASSQSFREAPLIFSSAEEIPRFLSLIVQVSVNALHPSVLCEWFLFDIEQKVAENAQQTFDFCLSAHPASRTKALTELVSALPFSSLKTNGRSAALMNIPFLLLRHRLLASSGHGWDAIDNYFLGATRLPAPPRADLVELLKLGRENRSAEGSKHRQVSIRLRVLL